MARRSLLALIAIPLALAAGAALPAAARPATTARITLSLHVGPPTTQVIVRGVHYLGGEIVDLTFDLQPLGVATADGHGGFRARVAVPTDAQPNIHGIRATGETSDLTGKATFLVQTDWPQFHFDPMNRGFNPYENTVGPGNVSGLQELWRYHAGSLASSPAVVGGRVFVGATGGDLVALDAATGAVVWDSGIQGVVAAPAVVGGVVYVGAIPNAVYAVDSETGAILWSRPVGAIVSSPAVADGVVYVGVVDEFLHAIDAATGADIWASDVGTISSSSPAVAGGMVFMNSVETIQGVDGTDGTVLWRESGWAVQDTSPAVSNDVVYSSTVLGHVLALSGERGSTVWIRHFPQFISASSPAVADNVLYVAEGRLFYAMDAVTGFDIWSIHLGDQEIWSAPAVANGVVYVGSDDDNLYALDATDGTVLWQVTLGAEVESAPVVVDGRVFVGGGDGYVYAFGLPG